MRIGVDRIPREREIAILQVGAYVIGGVGRDPRGRFRSLRRLVVPEYVTTEPLEYEVRPNPRPRPAPLARVIAALIVLVITYRPRAARAWRVPCRLFSILAAPFSMDVRHVRGRPIYGT